MFFDDISAFKCVRGVKFSFRKNFLCFNGAKTNRGQVPRVFAHIFSNADSPRPQYLLFIHFIINFHNELSPFLRKKPSNGKVYVVLKKNINERPGICLNLAQQCGVARTDYMERVLDLCTILTKLIKNSL